MKTIYIPKGETVQYEVLSADRLVVRGCLRVAGDIRPGASAAMGSSTRAPSTPMSSAPTRWRARRSSAGA